MSESPFYLDCWIHFCKVLSPIRGVECWRIDTFFQDHGLYMYEVISSSELVNYRYCTTTIVRLVQSLRSSSDNDVQQVVQVMAVVG